MQRFDEEGSLHVHDGEDVGCDSDDYDVEDERACMGRAALKKYQYESEGDENTEEVIWYAGITPFTFTARCPNAHLKQVPVRTPIGRQDTFDRFDNPVTASSFTMLYSRL